MLKEVYNGTNKKEAWISSPFFHTKIIPLMDNLWAAIVRSLGYPSLLDVPGASTYVHHNNQYRL